MRWSKILLMVTAILLSILICAPANAATIHIPTDAATITEGLAATMAGDTVLVAPGMYLEHDLVVPAGVCLRGATGEPADVVVDAQQQGRVVTCADLAELVRIEALTLTGGLSTLETTGWHMGGGLLIDAALVEVRNCRIIDNEAEMEGGGIACDNGADAVITGCIVTGNRSVDGAGIACRASSPLLENCVIAVNDGLVWGGALFCRTGSNPRVVGCTLVGNEAYCGAGIWAVDCPDIAVESSVIAFGIDGEGVFAYDNPSHPSEIRLICCNVFGNEGGGYGGTSPDQTGIDGNIAADPHFCDLDSFDYTLATDSPCLPANNDCNVLMGALGQGCDLPTLVGEDAGGGLPSVTRLLQNSPNPFNPRTVITLELVREGVATLFIYDARGRRVRDLIAGQLLSAGVHLIAWDGRDAVGRKLPSGMYLCRIASDDGVETRKMTLAR